MDSEGYKYNEKINKNYRFNKNNIYTLDNISLWLKINNYKNKLLPSTYVNCNSKLNFTCDMCGESFKTTFNHLKNMNQTHCKKCGKIIFLNKDRFSIDYIREYYKEKGLELLEYDYTGVKQRLSVKNKHGYKSKISYNSLKNNCNIEIFSKSNPYTIYNIKQYIKINKLNSIIISEKFIDKKSKLEFKCECGSIFKTTLDSFINGKDRCDICSKNQSKYEFLVEQYLKRNKLIYEKEYWFDDCRDKYPLPFDFVLKSKEGLIENIIECDGQGHYKPTSFNGISKEESKNRYYLTKYHDEIKNKYCKDNNISLLRIPYWEFKNNNYINILNDKLYI